MVKNGVLGLALSAILLPPAARVGAGAVRIGEKVPNLTFKDVWYLPRSLDELGKKKALVLVFTNTTCPLVRRYLPKLKALEKEYRDQGVGFAAINAGDSDSILEMAAQAVEYGLQFPCVKDTDGSCARTLGVTRTPEAVVLDSEHRLRYRGRIDNQYRLGGARPRATRSELREAIEAVLAGREVPVSQTPVDGCLITLPEPPSPDAPVTFSEHVAPLIQKHCQECHRPGTEAPFSLVTYAEVAGQAKMIAEVVAERRMPPWYADPRHGTFGNRRGMSLAERETILAWVRGGRLRGDPAKMPEPPRFGQEGGWVIGKPDLVISTLSEHTLPADGYIPYQYAVLPYLFTRETWIEAVQILPSNPSVVHHCNMGTVNLVDGRLGFVTGKVPGVGRMRLTDGIGVLIPKGSVLVLQIHYVSTGKPEKNRIRIGFRYFRGVVRKRLRYLMLNNRRFAIPPGAPAHRVTASKVLRHDATGLGMFAHMHLRGKDMSFRAHYPDGRTETLLVIPNYSFDWQLSYHWPLNTKKFPKGTRLECIAHFDNSEFNPYNPDPTVIVRDGAQTYHEMMYGFVFYTDDAEDLGLRIDPRTGGVIETKAGG